VIGQVKPSIADYKHYMTYAQRRICYQNSIKLTVDYISAAEICRVSYDMTVMCSMGAVDSRFPIHEKSTGKATSNVVIVRSMPSWSSARLDHRSYAI
jgi:hypothetical protein